MGITLRVILNVSLVTMMVDDLSGFAPADIGLGSCLQSMTDELNALHTDTRNFQKLQNLMIVRKQRTEQKAGFIKS
ncbi:hypothetical protein Y1Q_0000546 [Alligator mississippiensis]|uniref:Uncharacterized protein n=1 Tax=Alligator mississippiensis TaxID=8496 RepID=A0A151MBG7_ALLMI|nr:hypothetical protein Y1Q_0000546 [Alligator mississippiensis]